MVHSDILIKIQAVIMYLFKWIIFLSILLFSLTAAFAHAENTENQIKTTIDHPKIGLVLSGGGARGAAHIGVLKVLDDLNIKIDYITGTSMGAVIGGLYASGYTAEQIERITLNFDWKNTFTDLPARRLLQYRYKKRSDDKLLNIRLGIQKGKLILPKGIIKGQKLALALKNFTYHVHNIRDFNKLHIPFKAVATNIETGKPETLDKGDLALAMFASMAIPTFLPPVELDGKMLVDGGISNNLPIELARSMGADIIIAVDVGTPLKTKKDLITAADVTSQLMLLLGNENNIRQISSLKKNHDILITPHMPQYSTIDFLKLPEIIKIGEKAAKTQKAEFSSYQSDTPHIYKINGKLLNDYSDHLYLVVIDQVRLSNNSDLSNEMILAHADIPLHSLITTGELKKRIGKIYGLNAFERVSYDIIKENGKTILLLRAKKNSIGKNHLRFGMNFTDNLKGANNYRLYSSLSLTELNNLGAELKINVIAGNELLLGGEFYQPINNGSNVFIRAKLEFSSRTEKITDNEDKKFSFRLVSQTADLEAGFLLGTWGEIYAAIGGRRDKIIYDEGHLNEFTSLTYKSLLLNAGIEIDTLDQIDFPNFGHRTEFKITHGRTRYPLLPDGSIAPAAKNFTRFYASYRKVFSLDIIDHINFFDEKMDIIDFTAKAGITLNTQKIPALPFRLGGFLNLSGLEIDSLHGQQMLYASARYRHRITEDSISFLSFPVYVGGAIEAGNIWQEKENIKLNDLIYSGSIFAGIDTPIGALFLGFGLSSNKRQSLYLYLGQPF
jgi:NTE family protein